MVAQLPPPHEQPLHRSLNSRVPTGVVFVNETERPVQVVWLNYAGTPHLYLTLQPGATTLQYTYCAHPWCFRAAADPAAVLTVDSQPVWYPPPRQHPPARARIREAARQPWCPAQHQHTPPAFQGSVRALLLSHRRLAVGGGGGGGVPPTPLAARKLSGLVSSQKDMGSLCTARLGAWAARLRSALRRGARQSPPPERGAQPAEEAAHALNLGDLPEELLLNIVAAAAPSVPVLVKPAVPAGVEQQGLTAEARELLFREEEEEEGSSSGASTGGSAVGSLGGTAVGRTTSGGGWRPQQRDVPAEQVLALLQQQEHPAPAPVGAHHPLQFAAAPPAPPL